MARNNRDRGTLKRTGIPWEASYSAKRNAEVKVSGIFFVNNLEENFKELHFDPNIDLIHQIGDVIDVKSGSGYPLFACAKKLTTSPKMDSFFRFRNYLDLQSIGVSIPGVILTPLTQLSAISGKLIAKDVSGFSEAKFRESVAQGPAPSDQREPMRIHIPTVNIETATSLPKGQSVLRLNAFTQMVKDQAQRKCSAKVITLIDEGCVPLKVLIKVEHLISIGHIPREDEIVCLRWFMTHRRENQSGSMLISTEQSSIEIVQNEATKGGLQSLKSTKHEQMIEGEIVECNMSTYPACPDERCYLPKVRRIQGQEDPWECRKCDQKYKKDELAEGLRMQISSEGSNGEITESVVFTQSIAPLVRDGEDPSELPTTLLGQRLTGRRSRNVVNDMMISQSDSNNLPPPPNL